MRGVVCRLCGAGREVCAEAGARPGSFRLVRVHRAGAVAGGVSPCVMAARWAAMAGCAGLRLAVWPVWGVCCGGGVGHRARCGAPSRCPSQGVECLLELVGGPGSGSDASASGVGPGARPVSGAGSECAGPDARPRNCLKSPGVQGFPGLVGSVPQGHPGGGVVACPVSGRAAGWRGLLCTPAPALSPLALTIVLQRPEPEPDRDDPGGGLVVLARRGCRRTDAPRFRLTSRPQRRVRGGLVGGCRAW